MKKARQDPSSQTRENATSFKISFRTDKGLVKVDNQDELAVKQFADGSLLVAVADGLSGQPSGGRASSIAKQCVLDFSPGPGSFQNQLVNLLQLCDQKILQAAEKELPDKEMGTTLTVAYIGPGIAHWAHLGDCRLYLGRDGILTQITEDDTLAAYLVASGKLTREEARLDGSRHGLFECLGRGAAEIKSGSFALRGGDLLLLSSDGLHDEISGEAMRSVARSTLDLDGKLNRLMGMAKEAGGSDNITVVGVEIYKAFKGRNMSINWEERRKSPRETLKVPAIGILYPEEGRYPETTEAVSADTLLMYIHNRSDGGLLIETPVEFDPDSQFRILVRFADEDGWRNLKGKVAWVATNPKDTSSTLMGIQAERMPLQAEDLVPPKTKRTRRMYPLELEFLTKTDLLTSLSSDAKCPLLNRLLPERVPARTHLITQGEMGDSLFIIQEGSCLVYLVKEGVRHEIARPAAGDIVGEMSLLTTEPCSASVVAESDLSVWRISIDRVTECYKKYRDLRVFLTDLVTDRYSGVEHTADRIIGKYIIQDLIGQGAWSIVYKGIHAELKMPVAIKMLKHNMAMEHDSLEDFENEARIIAQLNHENIVKIYDIEKRYKTVFHIMEYFDGVSLAEILASANRLPMADTLDILIQVCNGLGFAHEHGIVHQDIKPDNIFLQYDQVKIFDFGLAHVPGTKDDFMPGTVYYMAPEQITGDPLNERTDIYALGIMAYELVTGVKPFASDDIAELLEAQQYQEIPDPRKLVPGLPAEFYNILLTATQKDPEMRFRNVWELQNSFRQLAVKMGSRDRTNLAQHGQMKGFFLFYPDDLQGKINEMIDDLAGRIAKIGASLRTIDLKDH